MAAAGACPAFLIVVVFGRTGLCWKPLNGLTMRS